MKKYRAVFIGNRPLIISSLVKHEQIDLIQAFVIEGSLISENDYIDTPISICNSDSQSQIVEFLKLSEYDLCVSAGCPYILPVDLFPNDKIFINTHPSALPFGRGIHPINECLFSDHKKAGATVHYLTNELDAGDVINQAVFDITDDVDLDFLYSIIFEVEQEVFNAGLEKILNSNFNYQGVQQKGIGTYYSRKEHDQYIDLSTIDTVNFLKKVRAFSANSLGIHVNLGNEEVIIFMASSIVNPFFKSRFELHQAGSVLISNEKFLLLKLIDGIVRVDKWLTKSKI